MSVYKICTLSSVTIGVLNGYKKRKTGEGISNRAKYGTLGVSSSFMFISGVLSSSSITPFTIIAGCLVIPLVQGGNYLLGNFIGEGIAEIN